MGPRHRGAYHVHYEMAASSFFFFFSDADIRGLCGGIILGRAARQGKVVPRRSAVPMAHPVRQRTGQIRWRSFFGRNTELFRSRDADPAANQDRIDFREPWDRMGMGVL